MRVGTHRERRAGDHRHGHRAHAPRQCPDGRRVRQGSGPRAVPAVAHALGSHPGARLLPAGVRRRQPVHGVGARRHAGGARADPRGPDGSQLLAAAVAQELLRRVRRPLADLRQAVGGRGRVDHRAGAPARRDDRARVPDHRGHRRRGEDVRLRLRCRLPGDRAVRRGDRVLPGRRRAPPRHHVSARRPGDAAQPRVRVVRGRRRRRGQGEGQAPGDVPLRPGLLRRRRRRDSASSRAPRSTPAAARPSGSSRRAKATSSRSSASWPST